MAEFHDASASTVGVRPQSDSSFEWVYENVSKVSGKEVTSASIEDFSGMGGLNATMRRLVVEFADGSTKKYVYKTVLPNSYQKSKDLGLPREAFFYHYLAPTLAQHGVQLPEVVLVHGDMSTGEKTMILEDLSSQCVQSGYFFGPGSPHNWGKDLTAVIAANRPSGVAENITMFEISREAFRNAARMHATYWMDRSLLQFDWLRSQAWFQGNDFRFPVAPLTFSLLTSTHSL